MISRTAQNYLRQIYELVEQKGYARIKDIAEALNVSAPSVIEMVEKLAFERLVIYEKGEAIILTEEGRSMASTINQRYQVFLKLFRFAGVSQKTAYRDACLIEHYISDETNKSIKDLVERLEKENIKI